jgi:hypothetical protein
MLAPFEGRIRSIAAPQGAYRLHGGNDYWGRTLEKLPVAIEAYEAQCRALDTYLSRSGIPHDPEEWIRRSWLHRLRDAVADVESAVPAGQPLALLDEDQWAANGRLGSRGVTPFPERGGAYWGRPAGDEECVAELERARRSGVRYLAVAWPAFWWLEHYPAFALRLAGGRCLVENDRVHVYEIGEKRVGGR